MLGESIIRQNFHPGHDSSGSDGLRYGQHTVCGGVELVRVILHTVLRALFFFEKMGLWETYLG